MLAILCCLAATPARAGAAMADLPQDQVPRLKAFFAESMERYGLDTVASCRPLFDHPRPITIESNTIGVLCTRTAQMERCNLRSGICQSAGEKEVVERRYLPADGLSAYGFALVKVYEFKILGVSLQKGYDVVDSLSLQRTPEKEGADKTLNRISVTQATLAMAIDQSWRDAKQTQERRLRFMRQEHQRRQTRDQLRKAEDKLESIKSQLGAGPRF